MGMAKGMTVTGIAAIVIGIGAYFIIRNTPQELSIYPDNVSKEVYEREYVDLSEREEPLDGIFPPEDRKEMWLVALIVGINQLVTTGVMSQMVPKKHGIRIFSDTGSVPDDRMRHRRSGRILRFRFSLIRSWVSRRRSKGYLVWYAAALAINVVMNNAIGGYICVAMVGIAIGAAANFMTSLPASVFGRTQL